MGLLCALDVEPALELWWTCLLRSGGAGRIPRSARPQVEREGGSRDDRLDLGSICRAFDRGTPLLPGVPPDQSRGETPALRRSAGGVRLAAVVERIEAKGRFLRTTSIRAGQRPLLNTGRSGSRPHGPSIRRRSYGAGSLERSRRSTPRGFPCFASSCTDSWARRVWL